MHLCICMRARAGVCRLCAPVANDDDDDDGASSHMHRRVRARARLSRYCRAFPQLLLLFVAQSHYRQPC